MKEMRKVWLYAETVDKVKALRTRRTPGMETTADVVSRIVDEYIGRLGGITISQAVREGK